ncbi:uncharacterized protein LOC108098739 [Drosophila ficusphila]|uniref:uncharacterized protein LOC108098739 n=1 Tax=Drosophila ficusphila TaxID=30025 RepID=UPI001C89BE93|nr:uncharacterized protein LOC108098739 [Drosophila ficusphila]
MFRYNRKLCLCIGLLLVLILANQKWKHSTEITIDKTWQIDIETITRITCNNKEQTADFPSKKFDERFYVFGPKCKMPKVNPYKEGFPEWKPLKFKACTDEPSLISVKYDRDKKHYMLHLNMEVSLKHLANYSDFGCTYIEVVSGGPNTSVYVESPKYFHQDWIVPNHFLGVIVECHELANKSRVLQKDAFAFVQHPKNRNEVNDARRGIKYPSVFLFGIDSMSRMNFHKSMPLTSKFVRQKGWFEMEGYNKVGDNTLPNLLAVLTGRTPSQWRSYCDVRKSGCLDSLIFLWNHFHHAGYLTAYAEDLSSISTFNYLKMGFKRPPVDFYLRPFLMVIEQVLQSVEYFGCKYCVGRKHSFTYVFDFAKQLIERFVFEQQKPLFGLFWTSSFTRDDFRGGANLDGMFLNYMKQFKEYGLFDRSIVILLSDHGSRYGPLAEHYSGFLEERQPMLHIYLPPWYRKRYPSVVNALHLNRNRLSSNFDLHLGIRQLIEQIHPRKRFIRVVKCEICQSILEVLPENRSCSDAGIPDHWCTCRPFVSVRITDFIRRLTKFTVSRMNRYLKLLNVDGDCHRLKLNKVIKADQQLHFDELGNEVDASDQVETYRIVFTTKPNNAKFRSTVFSDDNNDIVTTNMDRISRLNSYQNESYCVDDATAKKFCMCIKPEELRIRKRRPSKKKK